MIQKPSLQTVLTCACEEKVLADALGKAVCPKCGAVLVVNSAWEGLRRKAASAVAEDEMDAIFGDASGQAEGA